MVDCAWSYILRIDQLIIGSLEVISCEIFIIALILINVMNFSIDFSISFQGNTKFEFMCVRFSYQFSIHIRNNFWNPSMLKHPFLWSINFCSYILG